MEVSVSWFYASGMVFAVMGGLIILSELWRLLTGQIADAELMLIQESEEAPHAEAGNGDRK
jgi:TRAP-type C4-dicarboxylate transport system permease small subunit